MTKEKIGKFNFINIKTFILQKISSRKWRNNPLNGTIYLQIISLIKDLYLQYIKVIKRKVIKNVQSVCEVCLCVRYVLLKNNIYCWMCYRCTPPSYVLYSLYLFIFFLLSLGLVLIFNLIFWIISYIYLYIFIYWFLLDL